MAFIVLILTAQAQNASNSRKQRPLNSEKKTIQYCSYYYTSDLAFKPKAVAAASMAFAMTNLLLSVAQNSPRRNLFRLADTPQLQF